MTYKEIYEILGSVSKDSIDLQKGQIENIIRNSKTQKTVVGVDVYKYSKMKFFPQSLTPFYLDLLLNDTFESLCKHESAFFNDKIVAEIMNLRIQTGDGFFIFVDTPLQALLFIIFFQSSLSAYNTLNEKPLLALIFHHELSIRFCITFGELAVYNDKYFGEAIIRNARIISRDKLNRLLIDTETYNYFRLRLNGIDTLANIQLSDLERTDLVNNKEGKSMIFSTIENGQYRIKTLISMKLESISVKKDEFQIYNIYLQSLMRQSDGSEIQKYVISVGNLNITGIDQNQ